jgi:MoaA/NifB/PqqE/SkfB family radical SAM enzyme
MERPPSGALIQLNTGCNLKCSHCSQDAPSFRKEEVRHLNRIDWREAIERLRSTGITRLRFTGGEVFLNPELESICRYAGSLGINISFVTNGTVIGPSAVRWLQELPVESVWISVYAYPPDRYAAITGNAAAYRRAEAAVVYLVAAGISVGIYFTVDGTYIGGVRELLTHFSGLGVRNFKILQVLPHGRAAVSHRCGLRPEQLRLLLSDVQETIRESPDLRIRVSVNSGQSQIFSEHGFSLPTNRSCAMGLENLWTIEATGAVLPCCLFLNKQRGKLFSITEGIESWENWTTDVVANLLGTPRPIRECSALSETPSSLVPGEQEDFVCPLTFAELPWEREP